MVELRVERPLNMTAGSADSGTKGTDIPAASAAERFAGDPEGWLPPSSRRQGRSRWRFALTAGPAARTVTFAVGSVWRVGDATWRSITWTPDPHHGEAVPVERLLPSFTGELGVAGGGSGPVLHLRGRYRPPGGRLGELVDALALHRIARATAADLLDGIAGRLAAG